MEQHRRLAEECAKLDPKEEQSLADLGWEADAEAWPIAEPLDATSN